MRQMRTIFTGLAGFILALGLSGAAKAGDLGEPMDYSPEPCCASNWYLKGFLGITSYDVDHINSELFKTSDFQVLSTTFEGSGLAGLGLGYQFNKWLRFDVTSEYRNRATFHGLDKYEGFGFAGTNEYTATMKSWVSLANAYWDIGCWGGVTPYVGGGIGYAQNWIGSFTDVNVPNNGVAYANSNAEGNFAWAVYGGLSYAVTQNFAIDLGYRYLDLGDAQSGKVHAWDNSGTANGLEFDNIHSSDIMLGARWKFGCCGGQAPMPVALK